MRTKLERLLVWIIVVLAIAANLPVPNHKIAVIHEAVGKTVEIVVSFDHKRGLGSGVIISKRGYILTARHMFLHGRMTKIFVKLADGHAYPASIMRISSRSDLALLKIRDSRIRFRGNQVASVANP